jgi:hypothetical protein
MIVLIIGGRCFTGDGEDVVMNVDFHVLLFEARQLKGRSDCVVLRVFVKI